MHIIGRICLFILGVSLCIPGGVGIFFAIVEADKNGGSGFVDGIVYGVSLCILGVVVCGVSLLKRTI